MITGMKKGKMFQHAAGMVLIMTLLLGLASGCQNKEAPPAPEPAKDKVSKDKVAKDKVAAKDKVVTKPKPASSDVPVDQETKDLVMESLMEFNKSIQDKDFTSFHNYISETWHKQITPQELLDTFKPFVDAEIDLSPIQNLDLVLDVPPQTDEDGVKEFIGHYPSQPSQTAFALSYIKEDGQWKLIGINVQVYPKEKMVPFDPVLAKLAKESLVDFSHAIEAKDFNDFHKNISTLWKQQITPEELKDAFQQFIDNNIALSGVAKSEAEIDPGASLDENGWLNFSGTMKLGPKKMIFKLAYVMEDGKWKLASIDVNVS